MRLKGILNFILFSSLFILPDTAGSVPASPIIVELTQPDGHNFKARQRGDENLHWIETEDGYTVIRDRETGYWFYAIPDETEGIRKSPYPVRSIDPESLNIPKGLRPLKKKLLKAQATMVLEKAPPSLPHIQNLLVIMVDFNNVSYIYSASSFQQAFFSSSQPSVADYYNEVSYGELSIVPATESHGTSNDGVVGWLRLNQNHPDCENTSDPNTCYQSLASAAIAASDPYINLAAYDSNSDGTITPDELSIILVIAGGECAYGGVSSPCVWAHQWELWTPLVMDGKSVSHYAMFGERHLDHQATIGVMVHELGHLMLGLPDLYDTDGSSQGAGNFEVMALGSWCKSSTDSYWGQSPVHPSAWTKEFAGFLDPFIVNNGTDITVEAASVSASVLKVPTQMPEQYFLIENRYAIGYDAGLQGCLGFSGEKGGIAIWHIDNSILSTCLFNNNCNSNEGHKLVDLEEADGKQDLDTLTGTSKLQDLFYEGNNSAFTDTSNPNSRLYGGIPSYISVTGISAGSLSMTVDISTVPPRPDLSGYWLSLVKRGPLREGNYQLSSSLNIINTGDAPAYNVRVDIYLSDNETLDPEDVFLLSRTVSSVRPGRYSRIRLSRLSLDSDPAGKYMIAIIDPDNLIPEKDETNNTVVKIIP